MGLVVSDDMQQSQKPGILKMPGFFV